MSAPTWGKVDDSSEQRRRALALELAKGSGHTGPMSPWQDAAIGVDKIFAGLREMKARKAEQGYISAAEKAIVQPTPTGNTLQKAPSAASFKKSFDNGVKRDATGSFTPGPVGNYKTMNLVGGAEEQSPQMPTPVPVAPIALANALDGNGAPSFDEAGFSQGLGAPSFDEAGFPTANMADTLPVNGFDDGATRATEPPANEPRSDGVPSFDMPKASPTKLADAIDQPAAKSFDESGMALADALDPPVKEDNALSGGAPREGTGIDPRLDAFSTQNMLRPTLQTTKEKPQSSNPGRYPQYADTIQQIGEEKGWQSFNPESVGQLLKGESGGRNMPPNKHGYTGYFQMRPSDFTKDGQFLVNSRGYSGERMTPQDFASMSFDDQAKLYANRLEKYGYDGTQNLGVMNAAPAYKNAPDDKIAYAAGSREAAANPAWVRASNAGGAVTVGGIKNWHNGGRGDTPTQTANIAPPNESNTAGLVGGNDLKPWQVASTGNDIQFPSQQASNGNIGIPQDAVPQQAATAETPVRVAQNAGALDVNPSMFSPQSMNPAQSQQQPQSQASPKEPPPQVRVAQEAQRQMATWLQYYYNAPNADYKKKALENYQAAQQAYTTATTPTEKTEFKDGFVITVRQDPRTGETTVINKTPQAIRDEKKTPPQRQYHEEYLPSVRSGEKPVDFTTWERENKRSGAITGDTQDSKNRSDLQFAHYKTAISNADAAGQFNSDLNQFLALQGELKAGPLTRQMYDRYGNFLQAIGVGEGEIGKVQGMEAIVSRLAPKMRAAGSGATSDWEGRQFLKGLPALANANEGNAIISSVLTNMNDVAQKRALLAARQTSPETAMPFQDYIKADQDMVRNSDPMKAWREWSKSAGIYQAPDITTQRDEEMRRRGLK